MRDLERRRQRLLIGLVLSAAILALVVHAADLAEVSHALLHARPLPLLAALVFVAVNYVALGTRFALFGTLHGVPVPHARLARLGALTTAINRAVGGAGLAGYSLRVQVVRNNGGRASDILAASLVNYGFKMAVLGLLVPALLVASLTVGADGGETGTVTVAAALSGVAGATVWGLAHLVVSPRRAHLPLPGWLRRRRAGTWLEEFQATLRRGVALLEARPRAMILPLLLVLLEIATALSVLTLAFLALGKVLTVGTLLVGYGLGFASRFISLAPGGLGLQEASMAAGFTFMGVSFGVAVLAVVLYRALMDWIPCAVAVLIAKPMLGRTLVAREPA